MRLGQAFRNRIYFASLALAVSCAPDSADPDAVSNVDEDDVFDGGSSAVEEKAVGTCSDSCLSSCPCRAGERRDCDSNSDCMNGAVCPADGPGAEYCRTPSGGNTDNSSGGNTDNSSGNTDNSSGNPPSSGGGRVTVVGSTVGNSQSGTFSLGIPSGTQPGDLLLLFTYRTDDSNFWSASSLNSGIEGGSRGWSAAGIQCAIDNSAGQFNCLGKSNKDLNQVVFYKTASSSEGTLRINMPNGHPGWAAMLTIRGANNSNPIRDRAGQTRCDGTSASIFPSVGSSEPGDLLVLSQVFDDGFQTGVSRSGGNFTAPSGLRRVAYVVQEDEAAFLFAEELTKSGATKSWKTTGSGASNCKDANLSIVIRKN